MTATSSRSSVLHHLTAVALAVVLAGCSATANAPTSVTRQAKAPVAATQPTAQLIGRLNPAVTQATIHSTICVKGWTATVRPPLAYTSKLKRQQLPKGADMRAFEEDHVMPLELGGAPRDPANLRPVPIVRGKADDKWESKLRQSVCDGSMTLAAARVKMSEIKQGEGR